jgi:UMF1 family MFS transporter
LVLRDRGGPSQGKQPFFAAAQRALREVGTTLQNIRRYRFLALFLLAFLLYNEGVQTVISQASVFASDVLQFQPTELILLILLIQILALPGAMLVGWLADRLGQKRTLIGCLAVWAAILLAAFFVQNKAEFWVLGGFVAMVMGGTQSVSRAIMGVMTPSGRTGEFFGFFNFSGKATSFLGPNLFGWILLLTGSARLATVSLLVFFLLGWALAARVNVAEGRRQAVGADV